MKIGELFVALGFDVDDQKLDNFNSKLKTSRDFLFKMGTLAAGALFAVNKFTAGSVAAATDLRNFNLETGDSIDMLQKWQQAVVRTNSAANVDQVTASFKALSGQLADIRMGKGSPNVFAMLGVDVRGNEDAFEIFDRLRKNFDKAAAEFGRESSLRMLTEIGIDPAMFPAFFAADEEIEKLTAGRILSKEKIDRLVELGDAVSKLKRDFLFLKDVISGVIAPYLSGFIEGLYEIAGAVNRIWESLGKWQAAIKITAAVIVAAFMPVTSIFIGLVWAINEVGKALRGLPTFKNKAVDWLKDRGEMAIERYDEYKARRDSLEKPTTMNNGAGYLQQGSNGAVNKNATINNTWNINSDADAEVLADYIIRREQNILNAAQADQVAGGY